MKIFKNNKNNNNNNNNKVLLLQFHSHFNGPDEYY
jgi:hypothetical protein